MMAERRPVPRAAIGGRPTGRWSRLCLKELRETLRDRRTLITLILMPLLVYPILSMVFQRSLISAWSGAKQRILIGVESEEAANTLRQSLFVGDSYLSRDEAESNGNADALRNSKSKGNPPADQAASGSADAESPAVALNLPGLPSPKPFQVDEISFVFHEDLEQQVRDEKIDLAVHRDDMGQYELLHREGSPLSSQALRFVESRLDAVNELILRSRLRDLGAPSDLQFKTVRQAVQVAVGDSTLSTIVPMILILMTVTGAVYPAIDLTAGERERGTLEMLMASPVPRLKLLLAKYVAVVAVAFLTALVNLTAMTITLQATGLSAVLFGESGLGLVRILQILALLVLFAAFFSAVLLALTSFARSFKEAQAYLIPLMLLSLGPGVVSLLPGLQLEGILAITPVSNIVLLARDLCGGGANPFMAAVAIVSTGLYTLAAIGVGARIFGTDAVMSGGQGELSSLFAQDQTRGVSSVSGAFLCLATLFPLYFVTSSFLGQLEDLSIPMRLAISGIATSLLFGAVPWVAARLQKLDLLRAFGLRGSVLASFTVAIMLGLTLWPIAHEIVLFAERIKLSSLTPEQLAAAEGLLEQLRTVPPILILLSMAFAPAIFEELFFRGYLFHALKAATDRRTTILVSALLFGLFHVIANGALSIERFLPSTFMGLVLGWLCYQSGSVLPGMLLHACHNGLLMLMSYYKDELASAGFGIEEQAHMPIPWIACSVGTLLTGIVLIAVLPRARTGSV